MPRYLGLDYLLEAITFRRQFVTRGVLTVPQRLDHVEEYIHSGYIPDSLYRVPWKRIKPDEAFLKEESDCVISDFRTLEQGFEFPALETFSMDAPVREKREFVPSSNPESLDSFPSDIIIISDSESDTEENKTAEDTNKETFIPYNFPELGSQPMGASLLEEVVTTEPLQEFLLKLPSLQRLLSCLKLYYVEDPLQEIGIAKGPTGLLKCDYSLEDDQISPGLDITDAEASQETFSKLDLCGSSEHTKELEETVRTTELLPLTEELSPLTSTSFSDHLQVQELLQTEKMENSLEESEVAKDLQEMLLVTSTKMKYDGVEAVEFSPCKTDDISFVDFNGGRKFEVFGCVEQLKIDSPVGVTYRETEDTVVSLVQEAMRGLTRIELNDEGEMKILTPRSKEAVSQLVQTSEKSFWDILGLRLREPILDKYMHRKQSLNQEAINALSLEKFNSTSLHVDKQVMFSRDLVPPQFLKASMEQIEIIQITLDNTGATDDFTEHMEKYPSACLHAWEDSFIEETTASSGFNALRNSILSRQKAEFMPSAIKCSGKTENRNKQIKPAAGTSITKESKEKPLSNQDPLAKFLVMRSAHVAPPDTAKSEVNTNESKYVNVTKKPSASSPDMKNKSKVMTVNITGDYTKAAVLLSEFSLPALTKLHQRGILPKHQHQATLPPEMTRFMVKQMERKKTDPDSEKNMLLVHVITCVYDMYIHCSLESAIFCLSALEEKYQEKLAGSMVELRKKLFQLQNKLNAGHFFHPKMRELCKYVEEWMSRMKRKDAQSDPKVLIVMMRDIAMLQNQICQTLTSHSPLKPLVLTTENKDNKSLGNQLEGVNCVITVAPQVQDCFSLDQFSLVVEYEYQPQAGWQVQCQKNNIQYLALKVNSFRVNVDLGLSKREIIHKGQPITLIGSEKVTSNTDLLQLLENRYNILIVERDYSSLESKRSYLHFADITLDEKTGMSLHLESDVTDDIKLEKLYGKLTSLHQKYVDLELLIYSDISDRCVIQKSANIKTLRDALSDFSSKVEDFSFKITICSDIDEVARVISVKGQSLQKTSDTSTDSTGIQPCLKAEMSAEERYLLAFPCFNSISAQVMLRKSNLKNVMTMGLEDLISAFPSIPLKAIQTFVQLRNCCDGQKGNLVGAKLQKIRDSRTTSTETKTCAALQSEDIKTADRESHHDNKVDVLSGSPQKRTTRFPLPVKETDDNHVGSNPAHSEFPQNPNNQQHMNDREAPLPSYSTAGSPVSDDFSDDFDEYGNFEITLSPIRNNLDFNLDTHKRRRGFLEEDSEEFIFPKPNEFTIAEMEGKVKIESDRQVTLDHKFSDMRQPQKSKPGIQISCSEVNLKRHEPGTSYSTRHTAVNSFELKSGNDISMVNNRSQPLVKYQMAGQRQSSVVRRNEGMNSIVEMPDIYDTCSLTKPSSYRASKFHQRIEHYGQNYIDEFMDTFKHSYQEANRFGSRILTYKSKLELVSKGIHENSDLIQGRRPRAQYSTIDEQNHNNTDSSNRRPRASAAFAQRMGGPSHLHNDVNSFTTSGRDSDSVSRNSFQQRMKHNIPMDSSSLQNLNKRCVSHETAQQHSQRRDPDYRYSSTFQQNQTARSLVPANTRLPWPHHPSEGSNLPPRRSFPLPPCQRASIGHAQPVPRKPPSQGDIRMSRVVENSPPMDLDYDEESDGMIQSSARFNSNNTTQKKDTRFTAVNQSQKGFQNRRIPGKRPTVRFRTSNERANNSGHGGEPGLLSLIPSKRKRLGLERIPGARDGQTRLIFS